MRRGPLINVCREDERIESSPYFECDHHRDFTPLFHSTSFLSFSPFPSATRMRSAPDSNKRDFGDRSSCSKPDAPTSPLSSSFFPLFFFFFFARLKGKVMCRCVRRDGVLDNMSHTIPASATFPNLPPSSFFFPLRCFVILIGFDRRGNSRNEKNNKGIQSSCRPTFPRLVLPLLSSLSFVEEAVKTQSGFSLTIWSVDALQVWCNLTSRDLSAE